MAVPPAPPPPLPPPRLYLPRRPVVTLAVPFSAAVVSGDVPKYEDGLSCCCCDRKGFTLNGDDFCLDDVDELDDDISLPPPGLSDERRAPSLPLRDDGAILPSDRLSDVGGVSCKLGNFADRCRRCFGNFCLLLLLLRLLGDNSRLWSELPALPLLRLLDEEEVDTLLIEVVWASLLR